MPEATLVDEFKLRALELADRPALREKRAGSWQTTSWRGWLERSEHVAAALCHRGLEPGDRVAIAASTSLAWVVVDLAVWLAGGVSAALHPTSAPQSAAAIIDHAAARFIVTDSRDHARRLQCDTAGRTLITLEPQEPAAASTSSEAAGRCTSLAALEAEGRRLLEHSGARESLAERGRRTAPGDVATIVYSSGTTGEPKGVELTHQSLLFEVRAISAALDLGPGDEQLLFLPLSHIFGRMLVLVQIGTGSVTSFAEDLVHVLDNMVEVNPTLFASVPRLFEKIYAVTQRSVAYDGPLKQRLVRWASHVGEAVARAEYQGRRVPRATALQHRYADRLVWSRVRRRFGSRLRFAISGGAPLSEELARWFYTAGVLVLEVYGLTECAGGATINRPDRFAFGSVGQPLPGVDVRVAADGEVQIRGPNVMRGYWQLPALTAEWLDDEGWLHTGDLGEFRQVPSGALGAVARQEPMLHITGRRKDLLVTAGGSNVAPRRIEQLLEGSPWISRAVVLGDGRPYLVALVTLDPHAVGAWACERGLLVSSAADLSRQPEVRGLIETEVELTNQRLASYERIRRFALLPRDLTTDAGELSDTLKVKRDVVMRRHDRAIEALYERQAVE